MDLESFIAYEPKNADFHFAAISLSIEFLAHNKISSYFVVFTAQQTFTFLHYPFCVPTILYANLIFPYVVSFS